VKNNNITMKPFSLAKIVMQLDLKGKRVERGEQKQNILI
jgi:hypothetical protein